MDEKKRLELELELLELEKQRDQAKPAIATEMGSSGTAKEAADLAWMQGLAPTVLSGISNPKGLLQTTGAHLGLADDDTPEARKYARERDYIAEEESKLASEHPGAYYGSQLATGLLIPGARLAKGAGIGKLALSGGLQGAATGLASSKGKDTSELVRDTILGGTLGAGLGGVAPSVGAGLGTLAKGAGSKLGGLAERLAEKATGATGREAERFSEGAGRTLLDKGIVKFGSSPDDIARAAEGQISRAENAKKGILSSLDAQGGQDAISKLDIGDEIERKINELRKDPGNGGLIRQLEAKLQDVQQSQDLMNLAEAESVKRTFGRKGYKSLDPDSNQADKTMEEIYRKMVESRAEGISPQLASEFKGHKSIQSALIPVEKAAERRASTLNQSPLLGARDALGGAVGGAIGSTIGGPLGGIAGAATGALINRTVSPRLPAMGAVTANQAGKALNAVGQKLVQLKLPEKTADRLSKTPYAHVLLQDANNALQKHFILTNTDENYRKVINGNDE